MSLRRLSNNVWLLINVAGFPLFGPAPPTLFIVAGDLAAVMGYLGGLFAASVTEDVVLRSR